LQKAAAASAMVALLFSANISPASTAAAATEIQMPGKVVFLSNADLLYSNEGTAMNLSACAAVHRFCFNVTTA
jgi:hypothetical protein